MTTDSHESDGDLHVAVWMRDLSPPPDDPRTTVLSRLRELEEAGIIDDVSIRGWSTYVTAPNESDDEYDSLVREKITEFLTWADRNDLSLEPAFRWCEQSTMVSEEQREVIRLPLQCLAVYEDDHLVGVFPCSTGDGTNTVADCLQRLEAGDFGSTRTAE